MVHKEDEARFHMLLQKNRKSHLAKLKKRYLRSYQSTSAPNEVSFLMRNSRRMRRSCTRGTSCRT